MIISPQSTVHSPQSSDEPDWSGWSDASDLTRHALRTHSASGIQHPASRLPAFTLIEIMIVVGIMAIVLTMGVPIVYRVFHRPPVAQAVKDIVEVCSRARAQAILRGQEVDLICHPRDRRFDLTVPAPVASPSPNSPGEVVPASAPPPTGAGSSTVLSEHIWIDMLDINLTEYKDADQARVRFYPNGTCDEFTLIFRSDKGEQRGITLEITTGLASVLNENDLQNLRNGRL